MYNCLISVSVSVSYLTYWLHYVNCQFQVVPSLMLALLLNIPRILELSPVGTIYTVHCSQISKSFRIYNVENNFFNNILSHLLRLWTSPHVGGDRQHRHSHTHTHSKTDIAIYRLNQPNGQFRENFQLSYKTMKLKL